MTRNPIPGALTLLAVVLTAGVALAAKAPAPPRDTPAYDTASEFTVKGVVTEVKTHASVEGYTDLHFVMDTPHGPLEVHVGPVAFLQKKGFAFEKGDEVVVTGCKASWEGADVLVAREVKKGPHALTVRSLSGTPAWPRNLRG